MKMFVKFAVVFLLLSIISPLLMNQFDIQFGHQNYWDNHDVWFLLFIMLLPRLTLLFSSVATGGLLWWLSWLFAPRLLVALLATVAYWETNPFLVVCAWVVCWGGESGEKYIVAKQARRRH